MSIEVSPAYAYDTAKSIGEAERLFTAVDRPNVMIKIPGTREGVPAILESLRRGLNINITLLFSMTPVRGGRRGVPGRARVPAAARPHDPRRLVGRQLLRLARRHARGRAARRADRGRDRRGERRRLDGAQGPGRRRQLEDRVRALPHAISTAARGSSSPRPAPRCSASSGRAPASRTRRIRTACTSTSSSASTPSTRSPRRRGRRSRTTGRSTARWTATSRRRTARCGT